MAGSSGKAGLVLAKSLRSGVAQRGSWRFGGVLGVLQEIQVGSSSNAQGLEVGAALGGFRWMSGYRDDASHR